MIDINKYLDKINSEIEENTLLVMSGVPSTFEEYRQKVGYGIGLEKSKEILEAMLEDAELRD